MEHPADLIATVRCIADALMRAGVKFHFTGGLTASFYGEPRMTQDIDIVVEQADAAGVERLLSALAPEYILDPSAVRDGIRNGTWFQALDGRTFMKIDCHVGEGIPGEFDRAASRELVPGVWVPVVSKEDALLSKLLWILKGSEKSRRDVVMMLRRRGDLDLDYIRRTAGQLGVADLFEELLQQAM